MVGSQILTQNTSRNTQMHHASHVHGINRRSSQIDIFGIRSPGNQILQPMRAVELREADISAEDAVDMRVDKFEQEASEAKYLQLVL